ncbi:MAG: WXG100 family type VII secretion target [Clostridiaceae bacterium]|nr:WXG100 family type VII secretion target [Clostridiaceae bacterium]
MVIRFYVNIKLAKKVLFIGNTIKYDFNEIRSSANTIKKYRNNIESITEELDRTINGLYLLWEGAASSNFIYEYSRIRPSMDSFVRILEGLYINLFMTADKMEEADKALAAQSTNPLGMGDLKLAEAMILTQTNEGITKSTLNLYGPRLSSTTSKQVKSHFSPSRGTNVARQSVKNKLESENIQKVRDRELDPVLKIWNDATYTESETIKVEDSEVTNYYIHTNEELRKEIQNQYANNGDYFSYLTYSAIFGLSTYVNLFKFNYMKQMPPEMSYEDRKLTADLMSGELGGQFFAVTVNGVRAYKSLKTGEFVSEDVVFGMGAGGGANKAASKAEINPVLESIPKVKPVIETSYEKSIGNSFNLSDLELKISDKKAGQKLTQHLREDFKMDPSDIKAREWIKNYTEDIHINAEEIRTNSWRAIGDKLANGLKGEGPALFYKKGNDVVVTELNGNFVTILKDGAISNKRFIEGTILWKK